MYIVMVYVVAEQYLRTIEQGDNSQKLYMLCIDTHQCMYYAQEKIYVFMNGNNTILVQIFKLMLVSD